MAERTIEIPEYLAEVWDNLPDKQALVQKALQRWTHEIEPDSKMYVVVYVEHHIHIHIERVIINIPRKVSIRKIQMYYHPFSIKEHYFLIHFDKLGAWGKGRVGKVPSNNVIEWKDLVEAMESEYGKENLHDS